MLIRVSLNGYTRKYDYVGNKIMPEHLHSLYNTWCSQNDYPDTSDEFLDFLNSLDTFYEIVEACDMNIVLGTE